MTCRESKAAKNNTGSRSEVREWGCVCVCVFASAVLTMLARGQPSEMLCWPVDVYTPPWGLGGGGPRPELLIPKE